MISQFLVSKEHVNLIYNLVLSVWWLKAQCGFPVGDGMGGVIVLSEVFVEAFVWGRIHRYCCSSVANTFFAACHVHVHVPSLWQSNK
jgi:hypothetical protein